MRRTLLKLLAVALPATAFAASPDVDPVKVVYHLADGLDQAARALANIRNHLRAEPDTKIAVVANGDGIKFLLAGARDRNGRPFDATVEALAAQGVAFRVCGNTLAAHEVPVSQVLPGVKVIASGVAELARLQAREGYAYIRP